MQDVGGLGLLVPSYFSERSRKQQGSLPPESSSSGSRFLLPLIKTNDEFLKVDLDQHLRRSEIVRDIQVCIGPRCHLCICYDVRRRPKIFCRVSRH